MIEINRNNYEEYFLDFLEGNLSPSENDLLMSFLNSNPDLKEELELLNELPEIRVEETFLEKSALKKSSSNVESNSDNFNELCIARIEGDLSKEECSEFDSFINENSKREKEFELFKLTKVKADHNIVYRNKQELKKSTFNLFLFKNRYSIISAAASIVIALALFTLIPKNTEDLPLNISEVTEKNDEKEVYEQVKTEQSSNEQIAEIVKPAIIEKVESVNKTEFNVIKSIVDSVTIAEQIRDNNQYAKLTPRAIELKYQLINKDIIYTEPVIYQFAEVGSNKNRHFSVKSLVAGVVNKEVFNRDRKDKIEMFDVAQASLNGINRITGSNMTLTRIYDENGVPDKTEFNSKLIAFSTPAKKD
jgi:hypothetical protein